MIMVAHDLVRIPRKAVEGRLARVSVKELDKRSGILRRHCAKHQSIYEAEDGSVRADAKGKNQNGGKSEPRGLAQHTNAVAQILNQGFNDAHTARLAAFLFDALNPAKLQPCPSHSFMAHHAAAHQILCIRLDVESQLRIHLALHPERRSVAPNHERKRAHNVILPPASHPKSCDAPPHSYLNATIGSTRAARRAGTQDAAIATVISSAAAHV